MKNLGGRKRRSFRKKRVIVTAVVLSAVLAGGGIFAWKRSTSAKAAEAMQASPVQSAEVTTGTISNTVVGTGTLADADPEDVTVPVGITIDEVLVESGDTVNEGDALATVDQTSVAAAISQIQESIDSIDTQLAAISEDTTDETVTATVSGTVGDVYITEGDSVSDVMDQNGKLMVLQVEGDNATDISITYTSGTVGEVYVESGDEVEQGDSLFELTDVLDTSQRDELLAERQI
jgi:multidrug efflux pump subunit AcrA (membrane-fusion protein)